MKRKTITKLLTTLLIIVLVFSLGACRKTTDLDTDDIDVHEKPDVSDAETRPESGSSNSSNADYTEEQQAFADFIDRELLKTLQDSYYYTHLYYIDPAAKGIDVDAQDKNFGVVDTEETYKENREEAKRILDELSKFDRSKLTRVQQDEYDCLKWETEMSLQLNDEKFEFYDQYFAAPNSINMNLKSIFTTFQIRNEQDAENVVKLLDCLPEFIDQCLAYSKKQQEKQLLTASFDEVIEDCQEVLDTGTDAFVLKTMKEKVDELTDISEDRKTELKKQIEVSFEKSFLPSYSMMIEGMKDLKKGFNNENGCAYLPNGKEYFKILLNYNLGTTDLDPEELTTIMEEKNQKYIAEISPILRKNPALLAQYTEGKILSGYSDYPSILEDIKVKLLEDYPEVKNLNYNIDIADPEEKLDEQNTLAYFVIPPIDGDNRQEIRVSPHNEHPDSIDTYMTVVHEGFPGHMYQFAYIYSNFTSDYLKTMSTDGLCEGYAVYSQYRAMDYVDGLDISAGRLTSIDSKTGYLLHSILDIAVNYEGWTRDDMSKYFKEQGYSVTSEDVDSIFSVLRAYPGNYETYGYGFEMVNDLRISAEERLGDKFNAKEFNKAVLDAGNTTYEILCKHVDEYVASNL